MGKNIPLRIGRKSKRELNPMEQWRRKQKQKKNLQQFLTKLNKKSNGEFVSKVKHRRSPSPETNDPMIGELVSSSSLRNEYENNRKIKDSEIVQENYSPPEKLEIKPEKSKPLSFMPLSTFSSKQRIEKSQQIVENNLAKEFSSSDDEDFIPKNVTIMTEGPKVIQNQQVFKNFLENDPALADFFSSISDLI